MKKAANTFAAMSRSYHRERPDFMFTGIVTAIGTVANVETMGEDKRFTIQSPYDSATIDLGASIAHDGCCLTVTSLEQTPSGARYTIDASIETLAPDDSWQMAGRQPDQSGALAQAGR
jgi:hypothetical protein